MSEVKMWGIHAGRLGQVDNVFLDEKSPCVAIGWQVYIYLPLIKDMEKMKNLCNKREKP